MKRTISLIIAIAVMVSLFIVPVSAAEQVIDLSTLDTYNFEAAGILDVVGFHFGTGGKSGDNSLGTLDLSGFNSMIITYRNGASAGKEVADIALLNSAEETVGVLSTIPSGGWGTETTGYIDISGVTSTSDTYKFKLLPGSNGSWITGITLSTDAAPEKVITNAAEITAGNTKLTNNITGTLTASSGTYVIDLAGKTWSATTSIALNVNGASVKLIDTVGGGKIIVTQNDAVEVNGGTLTAEGVTIISDNGGGDALFVNGGTTIVKDCTLYAKKAGIDVSQNGSSAAITVDGGTFAGTYSTAEERTCAIEFRNNNKTVLLKNDITFTNNLIIRRSECTKSLAAMISAGENSTITYSADSSVPNYSNYVANTINYVYSAPVAKDPAFAGASLTLSDGITINYYAEGVDANAYVMVDGEKITGVADGDKFVYSFGNFGPQQMGDEFTAELYVDGAKVDEKVYSVKAYCDAKLADANSSAQLVNLLKDLLNYGAAAQDYRDYNVDALVNSDLSDADKNRVNSYAADVAVPTISTDVFDPTVSWKAGTVYFGDTVNLAVRFEGEAELVKVTVGGKTYDITEFETLDNGYRVVVDVIGPHQFREIVKFTAYNANGTAISGTLSYSIGAYAAKKDTVTDPMCKLVKALMVYGDSAAAYVA